MSTQLPARYRVSLTAQDIATITSWVLTHPDLGIDIKLQSIMSKFLPVNSAIASGDKSADYQPVAKVSIEEQLGMLEDIATGTGTAVSNSYGTDQQFATKEKYWEYCYECYIAAEQGSLSAGMLEGAAEHMYLHNLLHEEQLIAFEAGELVL